MAFSQDTYTASASQQDFTVTFGYISQSHVKVYVDGVEDTTYTWQNATTVRLTTPATGGETIVVDRDTPSTARLVDFEDATVLTAAILDRDSNQVFYIAQESMDDSGVNTFTAANVGTAGVGVFKNKVGQILYMKKINAGSNKVTITDDTGDDEIDVDVVEANLSLGNMGGTVGAGQIAAGALATADIADGAVTNAKLADAVAYTIKMRNAATTGAVADTKITDLTEETSPDVGDYLVAEKADGSLAKVNFSNLPSAVGESNLAENVGTAGVGMYKGKSLSTLQFKKLNAGSSRITITDDTGADEVDVDRADIVVRTPHTWAIGGEIKVPSGDTDFVPPMFVSLATGQTMKLVKARYVINSGTSATVKLQKNGSDVTGFTSISVTTTAASTDPTDVTLAGDDKLALVVTGVSGTPTNLSFTIFLESTI